MPRNDTLKLIAMATMLIDHIGYMFFPQYLIFRSVGRLAFPIFAYQLAVGYEKTSNLKNYAKRLFIFGLISQIPYSFFSPELEFKPFNLNIMFTLLLALGVVYLYDLGRVKLKEYRESKDIKKVIYGAGILFAAFITVISPEVLEIVCEARLDYGFYGLLLVMIFHLFKDSKARTVLSYIILSFIYTYVYGAKVLSANSLNWFGEHYDIWESLSSFGLVWQNIVYYNNGLIRLEGYFFQARSIFALIPIYLSDSFIGRIRLNKYTAYWFYPVHIAILVLAACLSRGFPR
jgi:hypothetical protein